MSLLDGTINVCLSRRNQLKMQMNASLHSEKPSGPVRALNQTPNKMSLTLEKVQVTVQFFEYVCDVLCAACTVGARQARIGLYRILF